MAGWGVAVGTLTKSHLDTSYVQVPVQAILDGEAYDPTADVVQLAFMANWGQPTGEDWHAGSWSTSTAPGIYLAQCLVGPANDGVNLTVGTYTIWVQITDDPEVPVIVAGTLAIN
jgi:hypothetical protein